MTMYVSPPALFTPHIIYWIYWLFYGQGVNRSHFVACLSFWKVNTKVKWHWDKPYERQTFGQDFHHTIVHSCLILKNVCCLLLFSHAGMLVQLFYSELTSSVWRLDVLLSLELLSQVSSRWRCFSLVFHLWHWNVWYETFQKCSSDFSMSIVLCDSSWYSLCAPIFDKTSLYVAGWRSQCLHCPWLLPTLIQAKLILFVIVLTRITNQWNLIVKNWWSAAKSTGSFYSYVEILEERQLSMLFNYCWHLLCQIE